MSKGHARLLGALLALSVLGGLVFVSSRLDGKRSTFDGRRAMKDLESIAHRGHRSYGASGRDQALAEIVERFRPLIDRVEVQDLPAQHPDTREPLTLKNVLFRQHEERPKRIILGTHWDTRLWAEEDPVRERRGLPIVGANDGTSGIALLLEIARSMERRSQSYGIDYVLFDGEEFGRPGTRDYCVGSRAFAADIRRFYPNGLPLRGVVFDMVGDRSLRILREVHSVEAAPRLVESIWAIASETGVRAFADGKGPRIYDDHVPLIGAGIPTVLLIDYDYPHWHTHQDTPDQCDAESLQAVGDVMLLFLERSSAELAER